MAEITNSTPLLHLWSEQMGPDGDPLDVLVVRGTFDFAAEGNPMLLAAQQRPVALGDSFTGPIDVDPLRAVIREDGDLLPYKPGTDILVTGTASSPHGHPHAAWVAEVRVGALQKKLRLHGPREYRKTFFGWRSTPSEAITRLPLDYRLAHGGCLDLPAEFTGGGKPATVTCAANPAGIGWLPNAAALRDLDKPARRHMQKWIRQQKVVHAPQIEEVDNESRNPFQALSTQGFGPIARWWSSRLQYQGTCDDAWRNARYPLLPEDFDPRFYQSAPPDLVATPHLTGDEEVSLAGLLPEERKMRLPGWRIIAVVTRASGEMFVSFPLLDTVRFDLDRQETSLVWRANYGTEDPVVEIALAATTEPIRSELPAAIPTAVREATR